VTSREELWMKAFARIAITGGLILGALVTILIVMNL
jgi:hypothetical protein